MSEMKLGQITPKTSSYGHQILTALGMKHIKPQCPSYYENLEGIIHIMICGLSFRFDEYGDIAFSAEKARLDNFAIQLQSQTDARYIIVYAGRKALVAEAMTEPIARKTYLVNIRFRRLCRSY